MRNREDAGGSYSPEPNYERAQLVVSPLDGATTRKAFEAVRAALGRLPQERFVQRELRSEIQSAARSAGVDYTLLHGPLAVALAGSNPRPDVPQALYKLGRTLALKRIDRAIRELSVVA